MRSSEAWTRVLGSLRAQKGTVAAIGAVALIYAGFLAAMARAGTPVVDGFYARQRTWHVARLEEDARALAQTPGAPLPFELAGSALAKSPHVRAFGFFPPEPWGAWTQQRLASLAIRLQEPPRAELRLTLRLKGLLAPARPSQRVSLEAGGAPLAEWTLARRDVVEELQVTVPRERVRPDGVLTLVLHVEDPRAMSALDVAWDHRLVGVGVVSVRIDPAG